jgi:nicotinate-nucleotide pyrophosphorylase (carboxylating)
MHSYSQGAAIKRPVTVGTVSRRLTWEDLDEAAMDGLIRLARDEDLYGHGLRHNPFRPGDATTDSLALSGCATARLVARQPLVVCGIPLIRRVHLSGIATQTQEYVAQLKNSATRLVDTRKTTPGFRLLEKISVAAGGGWNHRLGLYDQVLIKDNHLAAAGATAGQALADAVRHIRLTRPDLIIECEVDSPSQIDPVLDAGADIILLDNFTTTELIDAVKHINGRALTEASGGITLQRIPEIAHIGLDFISTGALVHQSVWCDVGLDWDYDSRT